VRGSVLVGFFNRSGGRGVTILLKSRRIFYKDESQILTGIMDVALHNGRELPEGRRTSVFCRGFLMKSGIG
jgi:hypothetical protein